MPGRGFRLSNLSPAMNMREAIIAALRRDPDLLPRVTESLRERIDEEEGAMSTVVQAAEALEPIIEEAVGKRPSKLRRLGLKSAHMLASLATEDASSNRKLERLASGGTVGIVFVDVARFTTYTARNGDAAASELLTKLHEIVDSAVRPVKGEVVKQLGDGVLLAFPSASQAVRGAVSLRSALSKRRNGFPLDLRIAVHAGEPLVRHDDLLGHDVNIAARLLDHCDPGEVVVSESAKELAEKRLRKIAFGQRRDVKIKGLALKVPIFSVNSRARPR